MKKLILTLVIALLICFTFTGCSEVTDLLLEGNTDISYKTDGGEVAVSLMPNKSTVTEIVIPDEYEGNPVTEINDFAGVNLEYVTKVTIGKNVKEIGSWAFGNSRNIAYFEVDDSNPYLCDLEGVIYSKDMKTLLFYPPAKGIETTNNENGEEVKTISYTVPEGVETIRTKAFYKCYELAEITLPSTLKRIEEMCFFRCSLTSLTLPDGLTFIGKDAFSYCSALTELTVPDSVTDIGEYAFYSCTSLLSLTMEGKEADMTLGKKWYPTNNGIDIDTLNIQWQK